MLYAIIGLLVVILDQGVKFWITNNFMVNAVEEPLIPGVITLVRMHNDGAAFSILAGGGARIYFIILTGIFTVAVILALATNFISGRFGRWCLVLVTAGGLSNCLDRILYGYVVDMFKIDLFNFAVFNVADIFITVFCIFFIIYIIFGGEDKKEELSEFDMDDEDSDRFPYETDTIFKDGRTLDKDGNKKKSGGPMPGIKRDGKRKGNKYDEDDRDPDGRFVSTFSRNPDKSAKKELKRYTSDRTPGGKAGRPGFGKTTNGKKTSYEEEYEAYMHSKADARSEMAKNAAPSRPGKMGTRNDDPFAAWEAANAKAEAQNNSYTAKAMGVRPPVDKQPKSDTEKSGRRTAVPAYDDARPKSAPLPGARPAAVEEVPAPAPKPATSDMDFSLDDILSEFR